MRLGDVNATARDNRVAIITHCQLACSLEVKSDPALNVFFPFISLSFGLHFNRSARQGRQSRPELLKSGLQCGQLREDESRICSKRRMVGIGSGINTDTQLARSWAGSQEGQTELSACSRLRILGRTLRFRRVYNRQDRL